MDHIEFFKGHTKERGINRVDFRFAVRAHCALPDDSIGR